MHEGEATGLLDLLFGPVPAPEPTRDASPPADDRGDAAGAAPPKGQLSLF